jgi:O-succinylbenzoic acid--CoA ligase
MARPMIDWYAATSHILINPLLPEEIRTSLESAVQPYAQLKAHVWLASSGTESFPKMIALSKKSILISADAVNRHLQIERGDPWLNVLPLFHAGGLGVHARGFLSGSSVVDLSDMKWAPQAYVDALNEFDICYSALTPTHVYDLVSKGLSPPHTLKGIVVGGGVLPEALHAKAQALGWPLLTSYGMTEVCSQIATSTRFSPGSELMLLSHITLRFTPEELIEIKSESLLTGFVHGNDPERTFIDPKVDGWFTTQDKGRLEHGALCILGRGASFMKIGGENVNMAQLEQVWDNIKLRHHCHADVVLIDMPDERLGRCICLAAVMSEGAFDFEPLIRDFHSHVIPIAKIRGVYYVKALPRTDLFKLKKNQLRDDLGSGSNFKKID